MFLTAFYWFSSWVDQPIITVNLGGADLAFVVLTLSFSPCFRKAREDLDAKNQKLAEMEADYGDVVPRRDFERLEAQFNVRSPPFLPCQGFTRAQLFMA